MREPVKKLNVKSLVICIVVLVSIFLVEIVCAYAFSEDFSFNFAAKPAESVADELLQEYSDMGIDIDPNAISGMINPDEETGTKKDYGQIAYKINVSPEFKTAKSSGNLMIENHADNLHLIKVRIDTADGITVYQSGYIAPNMHIPAAKLSTELEDGSYECKATISAYDVDTQEIIGSLDKDITIQVGK